MVRVCIEKLEVSFTIWEYLSVRLGFDALKTDSILISVDESNIYTGFKAKTPFKKVEEEA